jgi:hypothetical protein
LLCLSTKFARVWCFKVEKNWVLENYHGITNIYSIKLSQNIDFRELSLIKLCLLFNLIHPIIFRWNHRKITEKSQKNYSIKLLDWTSINVDYKFHYYKFHWNSVSQTFLSHSNFSKTLVNWNFFKKFTAHLEISHGTLACRCTQFEKNCIKKFYPTWFDLNKVKKIEFFFVSYETLQMVSCLFDLIQRLIKYSA